MAKPELDSESTYDRIFATVRKIPRGRVATYGQIARLSGMPRQARLVGYALHSLRSGARPAVPWHRVINAQGRISLGEFDGADRQRALLEREGVAFDQRGRIDLSRYGWRK